MVSVGWFFLCWHGFDELLPKCQACLGLGLRIGLFWLSRLYAGLFDLRRLVNCVGCSVWGSGLSSIEIYLSIISCNLFASESSSATCLLWTIYIYALWNWYFKEDCLLLCWSPIVCLRLAARYLVSVRRAPAGAAARLSVDNFGFCF